MARHAAHKRPWWHRPARWVPLLALVVAALVLGSAIIVIKEGPPLAAAAKLELPALRFSGGAPTDPTWPAQGQGAVAVTGVASAAASADQSPVPIGSITKVMTAVVVLNAHPLSLVEDGPSITISEADVAEWRAELTTDQSNVPIAKGEVLTERQLLEGLLVHSGNDYAHLLARMVGGDEASFVARMNAQAHEWDMDDTHYADSSGFDPGTTSTAADQVVLGRHALRYPVIAAVVQKRAVLLPVAGVQTTYTPLVGTEGVVGIKSGLTTEAGGCDLLALDAEVHGHRVQIISAVLGQRGPGRLEASGRLAFDLATSRTAEFSTELVSTPSQPLGTFGWRDHFTELHVKAPLMVPVWPGGAMRTRLVVRRSWTSTVTAGTTVGWLVVEAGPIRMRAPVKTSTTVHPPTLLERLT